jgi:hypothetical protein
MFGFVPLSSEELALGQQLDALGQGDAKVGHLEAWIHACSPPPEVCARATTPSLSPIDD